VSCCNIFLNRQFRLNNKTGVLKPLAARTPRAYDAYDVNLCNENCFSDANKHVLFMLSVYRSICVGQHQLGLHLNENVRSRAKTLRINHLKPKLF
jgi:hypothetical protein